MKKVLAVVGLLVMLVSTVAPVFGATTSTSTTTTTTVKNVAPHIYDNTFGMQIKTVENWLVYSEYGGVVNTLLFRGDALVPYAYAGEGVTFYVTIGDDNGEGDLDGAQVFFILDKDGNLATTTDQITIIAGYDSSTVGDGDPYNLTFFAEYTVDSSAYGKYFIYVKAADEYGIAADNSPVCVGEIFLNPAVGIDVVADATGNRTALSGINFGSVVPGETDVPAEENVIGITNTDPDAVGMKILVAASATSLSGPGGAIPAENIEAELLKANNQTVSGTITMSNAAQVTLWEALKPGVDNELEFNLTLDVPSPLISGSYSGTMTFYALGL